MAEQYKAVTEGEWKTLATAEITHLTDEEKDYLPRAWDEWIARVRREAKVEALRDAADSVQDNTASSHCLPCHRDDADLLHTIAGQIEAGDSDEHR